MSAEYLPEQKRGRGLKSGEAWQSHVHTGDYGLLHPHGVTTVLVGSQKSALESSECKVWQAAALHAGERHCGVRDTGGEECLSLLLSVASTAPSCKPLLPPCTYR